MDALLNGDSRYENAALARLVWRTFGFVSTEVNNDNQYLARCFVVDFRRLQALRIETLTSTESGVILKTQCSEQQINELAEPIF